MESRPTWIYIIENDMKVLHAVNLNFSYINYFVFINMFRKRNYRIVIMKYLELLKKYFNDNVTTM